MSSQKFFINQLIHNAMQNVNQMAVTGTPEQREILTLALTYAQMMEKQLQQIKPSLVTAARVATFEVLSPVLQISAPVIDGEDSYIMVNLPKSDTEAVTGSPDEAIEDVVAALEAQPTE